MRPRLWTVLLCLMIVAPALGFLPAVLGERTPLPADRRPCWTHLIFVTCDQPPDVLDPPGQGFELLVRRGTNAMLSAPEDDDMAASAASLWSGQRLGRAELDAIEGSIPWTMASAAQRSGAATAAFLEQPLVTDAKLSGFERVLEQPDLGPERLADLAEAYLEEHARRRIVLWLHLADPGRNGERLDALLLRVGHSIVKHELAWGTVWLATSLRAAGRPETKLWAWLPAAMYAGRRGTGRTEGIKIAAVMEELMRLPPPDVTRGEHPITDNVDLVVLLRGGRIDPVEDP